MKPGATMRPRASMRRPAAASCAAPTKTMRPSRTPTSASKRGLPVPSMTVPPQISRSKASDPALVPPFISIHLGAGAADDLGPLGGLALDQGTEFLGSPSVDPDLQLRQRLAHGRR